MSSSAARRLRRARASSAPPTAPGVPLIVRHHTLTCQAPLFACTCTPDLTYVVSADKALVDAGLRLADARAARIRNTLD